MENITANVTINLPDDKYDAIWSGYGLEILIPNKQSINVTTNIGVRGLNCKCIVDIKNENIISLNLLEINN